MKFATDFSRLALEFFGFWPDTEYSQASKHLKLKCIITILFLLGFLYLPQSALLLMNIGDLNLVIQILATGKIIISCAIIKIIILHIKREDLRRLLKSMNEDLVDYANEEIREIMLKNAIFVRKMCISYSVTICITMLLYIVVKIFFYFAKISDNDTYPGLDLFVPSYLPNYLFNSPSFELIYAGQIVAIMIAISAYSRSDSLLVMLIMHVSTQFTILRSSLKNLPVKVGTTSSTFMCELGVIVRRHEHLNRFASKIDNIFNMILLLQIVLCSVLLCFQSFHFLVKLKDKNAELSIIELVFLCFYICPVLIQLYIYCYFGEMLQSQNEETRRTAYECLWYILDLRDARTMIIIMARTVRPVQLTAGKFSPVVMSTFTAILKTSMSYLSVLLATINDPKDN
ncbi:Odorant receptor 11 [Cephus cinctus]|nr:odorant receptor 13a isoform X2 [Cephus cinctus]ARN17913.1 odorant receptor 42 [Cephus cinctus]RLZ02200.1 Odorant receptor 11 [Cephus cinctus]